ncbi:zinc finger X-chromosomal protein-like [Apis cerana]|uniref:zinc finger X-chromosomal protein-like n=1 Tax=Apis cerana TaxID=7461 RepID=UPI0007E2B261|nr:zinc finger X-chromosomal protein-like [Apis cerana]
MLDLFLSLWMNLRKKRKEKKRKEKKMMGDTRKSRAVYIRTLILNFNVEEYRCNFCNCPYSSQSHLKRHLTRGCFMDPSFRIEERRTMNRIESRNHVCPKCSQGYKNKRTLDTHLRTVCGREPKFHCPYCGLRSKHPPNIYTHIRRRHKGEDLFLIVDKDQRC